LQLVLLQRSLSQESCRRAVESSRVGPADGPEPEADRAARLDALLRPPAGDSRHRMRRRKVTARTNLRTLRHLEPEAVGAGRWDSPVPNLESPGTFPWESPWCPCCQFLANRIPFGGEPLLRVPKGSTIRNHQVVLIHASPVGLVCIFCLFEIAQSRQLPQRSIHVQRTGISINEKGGGVSNRCNSIILH
jgi:hypothetical protein